VHKRRKARAIMREALIENPAPSIQEIARRLGYKSICSLRKVSPELYLKIVERHRKTVGCKSVRQGFRGAPLHTKEQVSRALEAALVSDPAITLRQVAIELGYANGDGNLSKRFPELCQALVKRRQESLTKRHQEQERALRKVLRENPPPTLREVETRLGYKNGSSLRKRFPELGAAILANHKAYRRRQAAQLLARLQSRADGR
jgi:AraC-like DNA-binding protein